MKPKLKGMLMLMLLVIMLPVTVSCTPSKYDEKEREVRIAQGKVILDEYLDRLSDKTVSDRKYDMIMGSQSGNVYAGYYLSNVIHCRFKADDSWYDLYADLEDGQLYSNYQMFDIKEQLKRQLKSYCEKYGFTTDYTISDGSGGATIEVDLISHDVPLKGGKTADTLVVLENVIPVEYCGGNSDKNADLYLRGQKLSEFDIEYTLENETFMDPRILTDYLKDSGNYIAPEDIRVPSAIHEYRIIGRADIDKERNDQTYEYLETLVIVNGLDQMSVELLKIDLHRENDLEVLYASKSAHAGPFDLDHISFVDQEFPLRISDEEIIYEKENEIYFPRLRFIQDKGPVQITRSLINDEGVVEKMILSENEMGTWVPVKEGNTSSAPYWYLFNEAQILSLTD